MSENQLPPPDPTEDRPDPSPEQIRRWLGEGLCRRLGIYPIPDDLKLSVVVAAFNEEETIEELVRRVRAVAIPKEIVIVDDGSTDGTRELLAAMENDNDENGGDLIVRYHDRNHGKGAALRTGFGCVTGQIVIVQDADLEYDPAQYHQLIQPIVEGVADVVYGSRFLAIGPHRVLYYWHRVANRILTTMSNMFTDLNLTDMETCYKAFRREVIEDVVATLKENRFGIDPELTAKVARRNYRIYETGVSYFGRTYQEGKKIRLRDAIRAFWCILRYWKRD